MTVRTHRAKAPRAREIKFSAHENARQALGELHHGLEVFGLSKGQFSLLDLLVEILRQTGPADVSVSTWTAARKSIERAHRLLASREIRTLRWLVDFSFLRRQPGYCSLLRARFGDDVIRTTKNHAKFLLIRNAEWDVVVRTSMNLNDNPRLESFEVSEDPALAAFLGGVIDDLFEYQAPTEAFTKRPSEVEKDFDGFGPSVDSMEMDDGHLGHDMDDPERVGLTTGR